MNAPALITESRAARALSASEARLVEALPVMADLATRLRHGDLDASDRQAIVTAARSFEARLLAFREACALAAGIPDSEDVSSPEDFENALLGAFERLSGPAPEAPTRGHAELGIVSRYAGGLR